MGLFVYIVRVVVFLFAGLVVQLASAQGIHFESNDFERARSISVKSKKPLFIDTYASWCTQCKKMDRIFGDTEVASFFNEKFVNLKVDMGNDTHAAALKREFDILFLPTMIFLDTLGNVKYMVDRKLNKKELLETAAHILNNNKALTHDVVGLRNTTHKPAKSVDPSPQPSTVEVIESPILNNPIATIEEPIEEKILYVMDGSIEQLPPELLYHEAYFRMELMNGSQYQVAKDYLASQTDWSSEKNMRFISDFVISTDSREFAYLISNRSLFEDMLGYDNILRTIQILVVKKLYQSIDRPSFEEAQKLLAYVDPRTSYVEAMIYYTERMYQEQNYTEYEKYASRYLIKVNASDHRVYYRLAKLALHKSLSQAQKEIALDQINKAISLQDAEPRYYMVKARLLNSLDLKSEALRAANKSKTRYIRKGQSLKEINKLINELNKIERIP